MSVRTAVLLASAVLLCSEAKAQTTRIRLGTLAPQGTSYHRILQGMGERWRSGTSGRVDLTVYAGTMGSEAELVRRMRLGQLQAATLTVTGLQELDPSVTALQLMPMMFRSLEELAFVKSRLEPMLARRLEERGWIVLFWADAGWVRFFSRQSAQRPDDFRRLKIFVTAGSREQFDLMRSAGFNPVSLEWTNALTSLQTGMVDVIPTIPFFALSLQFHTVARYMIELNWVPLVGATVISKRTWDALSAADQAALRAAALEAGTTFQARGRAEGDSAVTAMQRRGLTVVPVPPTIEAEWRAASERLHPQIRGTMVPAETFDEVLRLLAEYRSSRPGAR